MDKSIFQLCETIKEEELGNLNGDYQANRKFDGCRIMAIIDNGEVILFGRRGEIKNRQFREVVEELKVLPNCILDGEIISRDDDFNKLSSRSGTQNKFKIVELEKQIPIYYMVFDIIKLGTNDLRAKPLKERIKELQDLFNVHYVGMENVKLCEYKSITETLFEAKQENQEGIIIKDLNAKYESKRSRNWLKLKLKTEKIIEFTKYETNNKGLRLSDDNDNAIQVSRSDKIPLIVNEIKNKGKIAIECECLEIFDTGKMRQPVFKRIVGDYS